MSVNKMDGEIRKRENLQDVAEIRPIYYYGIRQFRETMNLQPKSYGLFSAQSWAFLKK